MPSNQHQHPGKAAVPSTATTRMAQLHLCETQTLHALYITHTLQHPSCTQLTHSMHTRTAAAPPCPIIASTHHNTPCPGPASTDRGPYLAHSTRVGYGRRRRALVNEAT